MHKWQQGHQNVHWGLNSLFLPFAFPVLTHQWPQKSMRSSSGCSISSDLTLFLMQFHQTSWNTELTLLLCSLLLRFFESTARCCLFYNAPVPSRIASICSISCTFCSAASCLGCFPTPKKEHSPGRKASCSQTRCCWAWRVDGRGRWRDSPPVMGWSQNSLPWPGKQQREEGKIKPQVTDSGRQSGHQHEIPAQPSGLVPPQTWHTLLVLVHPKAQKISHLPQHLTVTPDDTDSGCVLATSPLS